MSEAKSQHWTCYPGGTRSEVQMVEAEVCFMFGTHRRSLDHYVTVQRKQQICHFTGAFAVIVFHAVEAKEHWNWDYGGLSHKHSRLAKSEPVVISRQSRSQYTTHSPVILTVAKLPLLCSATTCSKRWQNSSRLTRPIRLSLECSFPLSNCGFQETAICKLLASELWALTEFPLHQTTDQQQHEIHNCFETSVAGGGGVRVPSCSSCFPSRMGQRESLHIRAGGSAMQKRTILLIN